MATRAKYTRVRQEDQKEEKPETDIIMKFSPTYGRYISRALTLFFGQGKSFVTIKAADRLMDKALWVAQILKRKVGGLHQITEVKEREVVDVYEPREEGLQRVEQKRYLTIIEVTLTTSPTAEQKKAPGYQAPIATNQEELLNKEKWEQQEADKKERFAKRSENKEERRENKERGQGRRDNRDTRGGERKRGRN